MTNQPLFSERELKFQCSRMRLRVGTHVYQIRWNNAM